MHISTVATISLGYWLLLTHLTPFASPPDEHEPREAARVRDSGPFKPELSRAVRQPSGAVSIPGESPRTWKDCLGNSIEGQLVGLHGATVFLILDGDVLLLLCMVGL